MKVDIIDPFSRLPYAYGEICGVPSMTFHGNPIAPMHCTIVMRVKVCYGGAKNVVTLYCVIGVSMFELQPW
jgi:hypothetical protein